MVETVSTIRAWVQETLTKWSVPDELTSDMLLALTEACTNIARHGYEGKGGGEIGVHAAWDGTKLIVWLEDTAPAFVPSAPSLPKPEALQVGGFGLFLIQSLCDSVTYEPLGEFGNRVTMMKSSGVTVPV